MAKKEKKPKTAEQKARVAVKQTKKASQKEKKVKSRGTDDSDAEDIDLASVLEEYAKQQTQFLKVTETACESPSPRSSATLIGSPANAKELFLFGGEYYNGALATFFNDLFVYHVDRDEWRNVTSPNSPLPRSGHAWCRGGNSGGVYLFGGEFSSPKQGTFYHYNDFWRLEPSTREWSRIESKGKSPPARSGHRMTYYKNYVLLFGGFQDTSQQTRYLQDLWVYDCQNFQWHNPNLLPATQRPDPRSSFSFHPHEAGAVIYGGYSRAKTKVLSGKQIKVGNQASKSILKPTVHQDTWFLRITQPQPGAPPSAAPTIRWEKRKKPVNSPNPHRAGATQVYHKGRGIMFGGVHDVEESEEGIESEFFDQLFAWNIERNRFFQLVLRRPKVGRKIQAEERGKRGRGKADEAELLRNLAALETKGSIADPDAMETGSQDEEELPTKPAKPILDTMPHTRFNAQLAVQGDALYIFGGTYEQGDREYTFDEMHAIDLGRLDGVQELYRREIENWQGDHAGSELDSDDDDEFEDEEVEESGPSGVALPASETPAEVEEPPISRESMDDNVDEHRESIVMDSRPQPRPFESLRDFFTRTSNAWQNSVLEKLRLEGESTLSRSIKEVRKVAFEMSEIKWWDCREEVTAEEETQDEAGIGEVISISERTNESGPGNRRR